MDRKLARCEINALDQYGGASLVLGHILIGRRASSSNDGVLRRDGRGLTLVRGAQFFLLMHYWVCAAFGIRGVGVAFLAAHQYLTLGEAPRVCVQHLVKHLGDIFIRRLPRAPVHLGVQVVLRKQRQVQRRGDSVGALWNFALSPILILKKLELLDRIQGRSLISWHSLAGWAFFVSTISKSYTLSSRRRMLRSLIVLTEFHYQLPELLLTLLTLLAILRIG